MQIESPVVILLLHWVPSSCIVYRVPSSIKNFKISKISRNPGVVKEYDMGGAVWHEYPEDIPNEEGSYLVTVNYEGKLRVYIDYFMMNSLCVLGQHLQPPYCMG